MRYRTIVVELVLAVAVLSSVAFADPSVIVSPKKIVPGGIMVVTVKNGAGTVEGTYNGKTLHFNKAHDTLRAVTGIDLNADSGTYPLELKIDGKPSSRDVTIAKKKYPVQRLTLPDEMVILSPENEARAEREQKRMAAIWPVESGLLWQGELRQSASGQEDQHTFRRPAHHQQDTEEPPFRRGCDRRRGRAGACAE